MISWQNYGHWGRDPKSLGTPDIYYIFCLYIMYFLFLIFWAFNRPIEMYRSIEIFALYVFIKMELALKGHWTIFSHFHFELNITDYTRNVVKFHNPWEKNAKTWPKIKKTIILVKTYWGWGLFYILVIVAYIRVLHFLKAIKPLKYQTDYLEKQTSFYGY